MGRKGNAGRFEGNKGQNGEIPMAQTSTRILSSLFQLFPPLHSPQIYTNYIARVNPMRSIGHQGAYAEIPIPVLNELLHHCYFAICS